MKKKVVSLLLASIMVFSLVACGNDADDKDGKGKGKDKKASVTVEDIQENLSDVEFTSYVGEMSGSISGSLELSTDDSDTQDMLDMIDTYYGVDLTDEITIELDMEASAEGVKNDDVSYVESTTKIELDSNIDMLVEAVEDQFDEETTLTYTDYEEGVKYVSEDDGDTWYYTDYEDDGSSNPAEDILEIVVAHNEDSDDTIEVEVDGDTYTVTYEFDFSSEFVEGLSKNEKKAIESLLSSSSTDVDLDDVVEKIEMVGEYADISIPVSISLSFEQNDDDEYILTALAASVDGSLSVDWDEDAVADMIDEAGQSDNLGALEVSLVASVDISFSVEMTFGYDEEDVEIDDDIIDDAVEYDEYYWGGSGSVVVDPDPVTPVVSSGDDWFELCDYDNIYVGKYYVPEGWELSGAYDTYAVMKNDDYEYVYVWASADWDLKEFLEDGTVPGDNDYYVNYEIESADYTFGNKDAIVMYEYYEAADGSTYYEKYYLLFDEYTDDWGDPDYVQMDLADSLVVMDDDEIQDFMAQFFGN